LRKLSPAAIADPDGISDPLALLNFNRFADWSLPFTPENAKQAVLAFDGDVYDGWRRRPSRLPTSTSPSSTCASSPASTAS
jgi:cytoplasmic iron level regulating protein YaaA (DUF328/UPF0246 family)